MEASTGLPVLPLCFRDGRLGSLAACQRWTLGIADFLTLSDSVNEHAVLVASAMSRVSFALESQKINVDVSPALPRIYVDYQLTLLP